MYEITTTKAFFDLPLHEWIEWMKVYFLLSQRTFIMRNECVMHLNDYDYKMFIDYNVALCKSGYIIVNFCYEHKKWC